MDASMDVIKICILFYGKRFAFKLSNTLQEVYFSKINRTTEKTDLPIYALLFKTFLFHLKKIKFRQMTSFKLRRFSMTQAIHCLV